MKSTLNKISLINHKLLTIGELPSSYLVSMTYEEQLLWLCNYLENTLLPTINELITTFNTDTEILEEAINNITELANDLRQEMTNLNDEVDNKLDEFMIRLSENINTIANEILTEKIENGELLVSLGLSYNESTEALTFSINSMIANDIVSELETLTTPSEED